MVPVRLTLKNFLSYGEQVPTLDFEPLHVVCLSGDNGHGKSALLDAITWAVWGEARKTSSDRKPDDGLLRIGTTEMAVEFEFDLEGDRYRIRRRYRKTKRGESSLEFQVYDQESGEFKAITQSSINSTQQEIIDTLRMDYTTFINSVFILQGRADEFTKRSARERKEILAEILGLSRYAELENRARERARQAAQTRDDCEKQRRQIDEMLQDRDVCARTIAEHKQAIQDLSAQITIVEQELDVLRERRAELNEAKRQVADLRGNKERLDQQLKTLTASITSQRGVVAGYQAVLADQEEIERVYQEYQTLASEREGLDQKEVAVLRLQERCSQIERVIEQARHAVEKQRQALESQRETIQRTLAEDAELLTHQAAIQKGYDDLHRGRLADEQWDEKRDRHDELERHIRARQEEILQARAALQSELGGYSHRLKDLKARADKVTACEERVAELQQRIEHLTPLEQKQKEIMERGVAINGEIKTLTDQIKMYEREDEDIHYKLTVLDRDDKAHCPLCDAALDVPRRRAIEANFGADLKKHAEEIERRQQRIKLHQDERASLTRQYKENSLAIKSISAVRKALAEAEAAARSARDAAQETLAVQRQVDVLKDRLATHQFAHDAQRALADLTRQQAEIGYDRDRHEKVKTKLRELQRFEGEKARLDAARARKETAVASLATIQEQIARLDQQLREQAYASDAQVQLTALQSDIQAVAYDAARHAQVEERLNRLSTVPARKEQLDLAQRQLEAACTALADLEARARDREDERARESSRIEDLHAKTLHAGSVEQQIRLRSAQLADLRAKQNEKNQQLGAAQRQADRHEADAERLVEIERQQQAAGRDYDIYDKLATAFGKDGIQALIIENAIPEIEDEANRILSRLTGNRTHITIEPLRDLKTGGTKETLDIKISDELGTRPYELFSGGEAFRTNFALRIALSKLLAHRAGTRLRTLVVDEGFGTQDAQGLEYLVEALQEIQDDFDKVVVVTHLEQLKNAFPARIEVTKYPDVGSRYEVFM